MSKVKAQPVRGDQRPGLPGMIAQCLLEGVVQQVSCCVIAGHVQTVVLIDSSLDAVANSQDALADLTDVRGDLGHRVARVLNDDAAAWTDDLTFVANLPSALAVERSAVKHDLHLLPRTDLVLRGAVTDQGYDGGFGGQAIIANEGFSGQMQALVEFLLLSDTKALC